MNDLKITLVGIYNHIDNNLIAPLDSVRKSRQNNNPEINQVWAGHIFRISLEHSTAR